jgi:hypothetical protein
VKRMNPQLWTLGTSVICAKVGAHDMHPRNSLVSWQDGKSTFHLLPRDESLLTNLSEGDSAIDLIQECGTNGSIWGIGNEAICKVKGWCEERQLEASTIDFVRDNFPSIPLPEVLYSWIDRPINRTFLILKRVHARTLNAAWPSLSTDQRQSLAKKMAEHCVTLAGKTSTNYESTSGYGVFEQWLMGKPPASNPTWLPMTLGPLSGREMKEYMSTISSEPAPEFDDTLPFYHCDLGPTNILVSDDGDSVAAIIDWEAAAYFPSFWVATRPATNWAYRLSEPTPAVGQERYEWSSLFTKALVAKGFSCQDTVITKWNKANTGPAGPKARGAPITSESDKITSLAVSGN